MDAIQQLANSIENLNFDYTTKLNNIELYKNLIQEENDYATRVNNTNEALQILAAANDKASIEVLTYIANVINQALNRMFTTSAYKLSFRQATHGGKTPIIHAELHETKVDGDVILLDFDLQAGNGISQIISFLFTLSVIELTGVRQFIMLDETLKGFNPQALEIVIDIITVFAQHGFQFVMVEYDMNMGKLYLVEQDLGVSHITHKETIDQSELYQPVPDNL